VRVAYLRPDGREATGYVEASRERSLAGWPALTGKHRTSAKGSKSGFLGRGEGLPRGEGHSTRATPPQRPGQSPQQARATPKIRRPHQAPCRVVPDNGTAARARLRQARPSLSRGATPNEEE